MDGSGLGSNEQSLRTGGLIASIAAQVRKQLAFINIILGIAGVVASLLCSVRACLLPMAASSGS